MGGSVSAGANNDELIENLVEAELIRTPLVEQVFRAVDRGNYFTPDQRVNAYKDIAWRNGNLQLSAPSVYSEVMEALKLEPGLSFLNLGSGTGYLSTMAGLMLGPYGINHGIELYSDNVKYAKKILNDFMENETAVDDYDFCEPSFIVGDCFLLDNNCPQYDRVYCGASCPREYETYIKNLVKVGGILVMPRNDKLLKLTRIEESTWSTTRLLSAPFAPLITPSSLTQDESPKYVTINNFCPPKLKHICRYNIRKVLKENIDKDYPNLKNRIQEEIENRRNVHRIVIPVFDETDSSDYRQSNSDGPDDSISTISSGSSSEDFLCRPAEKEALNVGLEVQSHSFSTDNIIKTSNDKENWRKNANDKANSENNTNSENKTDSENKTKSENNTNSENKTDSENKTKSENKAKSENKPKPEIKIKCKSNSNSKKLTCRFCDSFLHMLENDDSLPSSSKKLTSDELKQTRKHTSPRKQIRRSKASTKQAVKKRKLSRKQPDSDDESISDCQTTARVKHTAGTIEWEEIFQRNSDSEEIFQRNSDSEEIFQRNSDSDTEEVSRNDNIAKEEDNVKKDSDNDDTYTKHIIKRIASLPLPSSLILYLSYK